MEELTRLPPVPTRPSHSNVRAAQYFTSSIGLDNLLSPYRLPSHKPAHLLAPQVVDRNAIVYLRDSPQVSSYKSRQ